MAKVTHKNVTPQMVKAARALIDWNAADLAAHSSISPRTVRAFESGGTVNEESRTAIITALEAAGVQLLNGGRAGARMTSK